MQRNSDGLMAMRFLGKKNVRSILEIALRQEAGDSLHQHSAVKHAAGTAVASIVARTMRANIAFLVDQVDIWYGEIMVEHDFTSKSLQVHIDMISGVNLTLFLITADRTDFPSDRQNPLTKAFALLPQESLRMYNEGIINARYILEEKVLGETMQLVDEISMNPEKDWQDEVRLLLQDTVARHLWTLDKRFRELGENMDSIVKSLYGDWSKDVCQIQGGG